MKDTIKLSPKIMELESSNDIYMTLKMIILTSNVNLNGAKFTEDFIDGIVENQQSFIGIPLVVNRTKLENEVYDSLSHEFDGTSLKTDMVGSFVNFEKSLNEDGSFNLIGEARVMKRYPKTCEAIIQLYQDDKLRFSCEVLVYEYGSVSDGIREIPYAEGKNALFANAIVTSPAEPKAKPMMLVAEAISQALEEDLQQGGQIMPTEELFNKGVEIKFCGTFENCAMSFEELSHQIHRCLNYDNEGNFNPKAYIRETYSDHVIIQSWDDENLFSANYVLLDSKVVLESEERWVKGKYVFTPMGHMNLQEEEYNNLINELNTLKEQVVQLNDKTQQLNEKDEALITLNAKVDALQNEIDALLPIRDKYEEIQEQERQAELASKRSALSAYALNSKVINESEIEENEELKQAIAELNETFVKSLIADRIVCQTKTQTNDSTNVQVLFNLEGKDLIPQDKKDVLYQPRKKG